MSMFNLFPIKSPKCTGTVIKTPYFFGSILGHTAATSLLANAQFCLDETGLVKQFNKVKPEIEMVEKR